MAEIAFDPGAYLDKYTSGKELPEFKPDLTTFYYPATPEDTKKAGLSYSMEGGIQGGAGFSDIDLRNHTLEKFKAGESDFVAVAMHGKPTGELFRTIVEGKQIIAKNVDTGGGLRPGQIDIATSNPDLARGGIEHGDGGGGVGNMSSIPSRQAEPIDLPELSKEQPSEKRAPQVAAAPSAMSALPNPVVNLPPRQPFVIPPTEPPRLIGGQIPGSAIREAIAQQPERALLAGNVTQAAVQQAQAFDPGAYLAKATAAPTATPTATPAQTPTPVAEFDPEAYLAARTSPQEVSQDRSPFVAGAMSKLSELVPRSVGQAAEMAKGMTMPFMEAPHAIKQAYDVVRGVPIEEAVPESQPLANLEKIKKQYGGGSPEYQRAAGEAAGTFIPQELMAAGAVKGIRAQMRAPVVPKEVPEPMPMSEAIPEALNPVRGSGKFLRSYRIDKELGDRMEGIGSARESGALRAEFQSRNLLSELNSAQEADLGNYLVSERLKSVNPEHPQVLSGAPQPAPGTVRLYHGSSSASPQAGRDFTTSQQYASDYAAKAQGTGEGKVWYVDVPKGSLKTHDDYGVPMTRVIVPDKFADQAKVLSGTGEMRRIETDPSIKKALDYYEKEIKPDIEGWRMRAGLTEEAAAGKSARFISLIPKTNELLPPKPGGVVRPGRVSRTTQFARPAEGQAKEYNTNLRDILRESYGEVIRKARVREFYSAVERKGIAEPSTISTPEGTRTIVQFEDLPRELAYDFDAATRREPPPIGASWFGRKYQNFVTGAALTANPAELTNHMRRQLNVVASKPPIGMGVLARLEALAPYFGPKLGAFKRAVMDDMRLPENQAILQDIFDAGGGSTRSFGSRYESKIPGLKQLQHKTTNLLFGIPKGRGVQGWDLRMRVQLEKIRRSAEGNVDPQRIREFSNQLGQYGSHPDWVVRGLRKINPYAATTVPLRLSELKTAVGTSGLRHSGQAASMLRRGETLLRGTGGTLLALASSNYLLSGKWPWENDPGHEFDLNTGLKNKDSKTVYVKLRAIAPELSRPVSTASIPNLLRERTAKHPDYAGAAAMGPLNQGASLVSGPGQNLLVTAASGKVPYFLRRPGGAPELMDVAKLKKGEAEAGVSRFKRQVTNAVKGVNPFGEIFGPTFEVEVPLGLDYIQEPIHGIRPFGSIYSTSYESKPKKSGKTVYFGR